MRVSEIFSMGGGYGHNYDHGYYYGYYPDDGRWTYYYYEGCGYYDHYGYGYTRSRGLQHVLG
ncbi:MAG: hypothetical protein JO115_25600 [Pseudonocardiales bacterium]|nr:hypothetical protein [Pseudonocardiales bacterium]